MKTSNFYAFNIFLMFIFIIAILWRINNLEKKLFETIHLLNIEIVRNETHRHSHEKDEEIIPKNGKGKTTEVILEY